MKVARTVLRGEEVIRLSRNSSSYSTDMEKGDWLEMAKKENKEIKEAVEEYEILTGDALVKRLAEVRMLGEMEEQAALNAVKEEEKISIAKKLLNLKMPIEQIIEVTELTKEEIMKLEKESKK